jgi:beta-carotene hydroxylase
MIDRRHHHMPTLNELGNDLLRVTQMQKSLTLAYPFLWCAAYMVFAALGIWPIAIFCAVSLSFVTYGSTSHDLVHRNLGLRPIVNDILLSMIELLAIRSGHAYQAAHLHHHSRYPHSDDIESTASRKSFIGAIADGFGFTIRLWLWAVKNSPAKRCWFIAEGIACITLVGLAAVACSYLPELSVYVGLMIMGSWIIPLVTSYLPHDPNAPTELSQTRAFRGVLASILALEHLYHLEHHLYPAVPHTNWKTLARRLDPHLAKAGVTPIVFWI